MKRLHLTKASSALGLALCMSSQPMAQTAQPVTSATESQGLQLDPETLDSLEQQLVVLEALIDQQTERLVRLYNRATVEADPVKRQQIDALIARLTGLLDAMQAQRDTLDEQITVLRPMVVQSGSGNKK